MTNEKGKVFIQEDENMVNPNPETNIEIVVAEELEDLDFALQYFNEPDLMYVGPALYKKLDEETATELKFAVLSYNKGTKPLVDIVQEIKERMTAEQILQYFGS